MKRKTNRLGLIAAMLLSFAMTFCLAITASATNSVVVKDGNGDVVIEIESAAALDSAYVLNFKDTTASYTDVDIKGLLPEGKTGVLCNAYDIHFLDDGTAIDVEGEFTVKLRVPKALASKSLVVVHIADDGSVSNMSAALENGYLVFDTTHFSVYAVFEVTNATAAVGGEADMTWLVILISALAGVAVLAVLLALVLKARKKKKTAKEPVAEEAVAEESVAEEVAVEEVAVEEVAVEEPAVEEPTVEEPAVEEVAVEEVAAEEPAPKAEPVIAAVPMVVNDDAVLVRYRSSYMSRLIQAEEP